MSTYFHRKILKLGLPFPYKGLPFLFLGTFMWEGAKKKLTLPI